MSRSITLLLLQIVLLAALWTGSGRGFDAAAHASVNDRHKFFRPIYLRATYRGLTMCCEDFPEEKLRPFRREAKRCFFWIVIALSVAMSVLGLSLIPSLVPNGQSVPAWFQRSGSITTIGALVINLFVSRIRDGLEGRALGSIYGQCVFKEVRPYFKVAAIATVALTIVGTIVWGYGDLILIAALLS
ncbi:hypothetical protein V2K16_22865 [Pseudomonas alliivorans]|uniref:hypothetical protein n=1 Tax=Pseudomonas alliivorans TaxID=2810613 RepID=UPI001AE5E0CE|nr:hypothetical protein [Pseudomonas alliivorans]MBP0943123.1 hypothetical protein [Pseudomonas alliivorans]MEE4881219.1 hypothetical protein [Pseudomonas alliivorans]MEE4932523.1 hypothetical protein [Pseudomonas alliivorans]MEE4937986.1 hypothetical protein [Pseudomonas alliivorans]MEE4953634.1 hypothetical protein [Pseudomonas alliivorans]